MVDNCLTGGALACTSSDIVPTQLNPEKHQRIRLPFWVQRNKAVFSRFLEETFTESLSGSELPQEGTVEGEKAKWLHKHQVYVSELIQANSPYRGLLLYHGLGSGKTAASIFISEGMPDRRVVVMLPASIEGNYRQEIESFANICEKVKHQYQWCFKQIMAKDKTEAGEILMRELDSDLKELIPQLIVDLNVDSKKKRRRKKKSSQTDTASPKDSVSTTSSSSSSPKKKPRRRRKKKKVSTPESGETESQQGGAGIYGIWLTHPEKEANYDTLTPREQKEVDKTVEILYQYKYKFLHYNAGQWMLKEAYGMLPEKQKKKIIQQMQLQFPDMNIVNWKEVRINKKTKGFVSSLVERGIIPNPFDHKIVIVDEIHNLISMMVGGGYTGKAIYPLLMSAKDLRLIFLSGTPAINSPYELGILYNLLQGNMNVFKLQLTDNTVTHRTQAAELLDKLNSIDFYSINDNGKIQMTRNPHGFVNRYNTTTGEREGVYRPEIPEEFRGKNEGAVQANLLSDSSFINYIETAFNNPGSGTPIRVESDPLPTIQTLFPPRQLPQKNVKRGMEEARKEFFRRFVDLGTQKVKNQSEFRASIVGLTSFFHETTKKDEEGHSIFPDKIRPPIQEIPLSDYQFLKYCEARAVERESEFQGSSGNDKLLTAAIEDDKDSSYFKVLSRNSQLFVFPPNLERLWPSDLRQREKVRKGMMEELYNAQVEELPEGEAVEERKDRQKQLQQELDKLPVQTYGQMKTDILDGLTEANLTAGNSDPFNLEVLSPKYVELLRVIQTSPGLVLGYSQFRTVEGIEVFRRVLDAYGYLPYKPWSETPPETDLAPGHMVKVRVNNVTWITARIIEMDTSDHNLVGFDAEQVSYHLDNVLHSNGMESDSEREAFITDYLGSRRREESSLVWIPEIDTTHTSEESESEVGSRSIFHARYAILDAEDRQDIITGFNRDRNRYGADVNVLFITQAGAEGLSFFNVRRVCIMEPFWNMVKVNQVIGRARRNYSHAKLPVSQRNVRVHEFVGTLTQDQLNGKWGSSINYKDVMPIPEDEESTEGLSQDTIDEKLRREFQAKKNEFSSRVADNDSGLTSDQFLLEISKRKDKIISGFLGLMKETAVDCEFNKTENEIGDPSLREMECFKTETMSLEEQRDFIYYPGLQGQREAPKTTASASSFSGRKIVKFTLDNPSGIYHLSGLVVGSEDTQARLPVYDLYYYYGLDPHLAGPTFTLKPIGYLKLQDGSFVGMFDPSFNNPDNREQLSRYDLIERVRRSLEASRKFVGLPMDKAKEYAWIRAVRGDSQLAKLQSSQTQESSTAPSRASSKESSVVSSVDTSASPYAILGLPDDSSLAKVAQAFRKLKEERPDKSKTFNLAYKQIIAMRKRKI